MLGLNSGKNSKKEIEQFWLRIIASVVGYRKKGIIELREIEKE